MKEKMIKVAISAEEQAMVDKMRAGAKIIISEPKKASYTTLLIEVFKDIANKRDSGALDNLDNFIKNMKELSRADKWNYPALIHKFIKALSSEEFSALKSAINEKSALESWPAIGAIWGKKVKDAISTESR